MAAREAVNSTPARSAGGPADADAGRHEWILNAAPMSVAFIDADLRYRFVNDRFTAWIGRPRDQILGRTIGEVMGLPLWRVIEPYVRRALAGETVTWDRWVEHPGGERRFFQATYVPSRAAGGAAGGPAGVDGFVAAITDVTDRRRGEEALLQRTRTLGVLYDALAGLHASHDPQDLLDTLFRRLSEHLTLELYFYYQVAEGGDRLRLAAYRGVPADVARAINELAFGETVCGGVAQTGRPDVLHDVQASDDPKAALLRRAGVSAYACHPLVADGAVLGTLSFGTRTQRRFSPDDLALMRAVCDQVAVAVDRQRTLAALTASEGRLRFLDQLGAATRELTDPEDVMATVTRLLGQRLSASRCAYADVAPDGEHFTIHRDYTDGCASTAGRYRLSLFGARAAADQRAGRTLVIRDVAAELPDDDGGRTFRSIGIGAIICCPLIKHGRLAAMMAVHQTGPRAWSADDVALVRAVVERSWAYIERSRADGELRQAKEAAEQGNRAKDQFLAVLSHELRTPLTPVVLMLSTLEAEPGLSPAGREDLEMIRRNIALETQLIDDLLDVTRITHGKLRLSMGSADVHDLLRHTAAICAPDLREKRLSLSLGLTAARHRVHGDGARLQQVFWNLLKNAIKFTPEGGQIRVATANDDGGGASAAGGPGRVRVAVTDSGVGIAPEALPRLFAAFEQGEQAVTRQFGGLGLGLAISKAIVALHGGGIDAASGGRGAGATFTVTLPTDDVPAAAPAAAAGPPPPAAGPAAAARILLVDDHADTLSVMRRLLRRHGHAVVTATSVTAAVTAVRAAAAGDEFHLILSDIGLPDGTGHDLLRRVRAFTAAPAIALSGFGTDADIRRSEEAGFCRHLVKPVAPDLLEAVIGECLRRAPAGP
jgi:PAS domain S-box-containing protein